MFVNSDLSVGSAGLPNYQIKWEFYTERKTFLGHFDFKRYCGYYE